MAQTAEKSLQKANYGLRREILSPMEFRGHDPAGVRACRQRHMSCLCAGDGSRCCLSRYASPAMPAIRRRPVRSTPMHHRLCHRGSARPSRGVSCWRMWLPDPVSPVVFYHYGNLLPREATGHVFSLTKITKITERSSLKFTFDIFNLTNTASFYPD
jgi:hypothetical protein